jgi:hypothetical protein
VYIEASPFGDGKSSMLFDGSGDYIKIEHNDDLSTSGDFTLEFWIKSNVVNNGNELFDWRNANSTSSATNMNIRFSSGGIRVLLTSDVSFGAVSKPLNDLGWHHIAIVRSSQTIKKYFDGIADPLTITGSTATTVDTAGTADFLTLGAGYSNSDNANFYIDEIRYVVGVPVYTNNFTVPTARLSLTQSAGTNIAAITGSATKLLIHSELSSGCPSTSFTETYNNTTHAITATNARHTLLASSHAANGVTMVFSA